MYSSRPKARTAHIAFARLAPENLLLGGQNLTRGVARSLMYSSRPKARTAHIAFARLAPENLHLRGGTPHAVSRGASRAGTL